MHERRKTRKRLALLALALTPSAAVLLYGLEQPHLGFFKDDGVYLASAYSLASGDGYRTASLPGTPWQVKYPPLYPALLSAALLPDGPLEVQFSIASVLNWLALPIFAILVLRLFEKEHFPAPLLLTLVCLAFAGTVTAAHTLLADLWMTVAVIGVFLFRERSPGAAGLLGAAAYLFRTAALPVLAAVPAEYLLRRRFRDAALFCLIIAPVMVGWALWSNAHAGPLRDYNDYFQSTYSNVMAYEQPWTLPWTWFVWQAKRVLTQIGRICIPDLLGGPALHPLRLAAGAALAASAVFLPRIYAVSVFLYLLTLVLWPWYVYPRLIVPVAPFLVAAAAKALQSLSRRKITLPTAPIAAVFVMFLVGEAGRQAAVIRAGKETLARESAMYTWVQQNTDPAATFAAYRDALLFFRTKKRAESIHSSVREEILDPGAPAKRLEGLAEWARKRGHAYVVYHPSDYQMQEDLARRVRERLAQEGEAVFEHDGLVIFRLKQPDFDPSDRQ
ncbi:MAG: hypothetical protein KatS3mg005_0603 [Bryobacteraceae bacterium]|nr:MAG: hypothetical protein KatS3mg005_0603 [Bryobacteraceae bacterium]